MKPSQHIIRRIGETDQLALQDASPHLSLERAELRLQLVTLSQMRQEQIYFLQEAIVLLEQARVVDENIQTSLFILLSLHLAKAYMLYFELNRETHFALITQQILKPLAHHEEGDVYFFLAYACAARNEMALTRHWLSKYAKSKVFDLDLLQSHSAFELVRGLPWFKAMVKMKLQ